MQCKCIGPDIQEKPFFIVLQSNSDKVLVKWKTIILYKALVKWRTNVFSAHFLKDDGYQSNNKIFVPWIKNHSILLLTYKFVPWILESYQIAQTLFTGCKMIKVLQILLHDLMFFGD